MRGAEPRARLATAATPVGQRLVGRRLAWLTPVLGVAALALLVGAVWVGPLSGLPGLAAGAAAAARGALTHGVRVLAPGWLAPALVQGLQALGLGPIDAVRAAWSLGALGTALAFLGALGAWGRDRRLAALALPLLYAGALGRGDVSATLGTALLFEAAGAGRAYVRRGGVLSLAGLGAALLAAFSTHEALFLAAWGASVWGLLTARGHAPRRGAALVATLPAAALWLGWRFILHGG